MVIDFTQEEVELIKELITNHVLEDLGISSEYDNYQDFLNTEEGDSNFDIDKIEKYELAMSIEDKLNNL